MPPFGNVHYRSGTSFAVGTLIDGYLEPDDEKALYELWPNQAGWPEWLEYPGSQYAISCEKVAEVGEEAFKKAFGRKKENQERAERIWDAAQRNMER